MDNQLPKTIDCSSILINPIQKPESFLSFSKKLGRALENHGIVYLVNHGISADVIQRFFTKSKEFFELPYELKEMVKKDDPFTEIFGFVPSGTERAVESAAPVKITGITKREAFDFCINQSIPSTHTTLPAITQLSSIVEELSTGLKLITKLLLEAIALYCDNDLDLFLNFHKSLHTNQISSVTNIRSSYYFPLDGLLPTGEIFRLRTHCDWGTFTLLFQDEHPGLECQLGREGQWTQVVPISNSIVLQVGQTLETLTGGKFAAVPHRVRLVEDNLRVARQTIAFFLHPDDESRCVSVLPRKTDWISPSGELNNELTHAQLISRRRQRTIAI